jgi:MurNAc alpha-1-phosphate uridylyltransferase
MKAMILAAGLGTRLKPFTDHHPKALAQVNGKTLLELSIQKLQSVGIFDVVVNVHHFAAQIVALLAEHNGFGSRYIISDEQAMVLETGGGVLHAQPYLADCNNFLVMNVDIISNIQLDKLIEAHLKRNALATLAIQKRVSSRQLLFTDKTNTLLLAGWQNTDTGEVKPADLVNYRLTPYAFSGIQVMNQAIFNHFHPFTGKFSIIDLYLHLCGSHPIVGWDHTGDTMLDVGKPHSLIEAAKLL